MRPRAMVAQDRSDQFPLEAAGRGRTGFRIERRTDVHAGRSAKGSAKESSLMACHFSRLQHAVLR
jgi:hypothetical protein